MGVLPEKRPASQQDDDVEVRGMVPCQSIGYSQQAQRVRP